MYLRIIGSLVIFGLSIAILSGCKSSKKVMDNKEKAHTVLTYQKTPCYGTCPAFTFQLNSDGSALYHGLKYVDHEGYYSSNLDKELYKEIIDVLQKSDFNSYNKEYIEPMIMDLPETKIEYNSHKVTYQNMKAPESLKKLSKSIDELLSQVKWKQTNPPTKS